MGMNSTSDFPYTIGVDWKLLNWKKWQISDLLTTQVSNDITAQGNQSLVVSTNYGAEALSALPAALYNTHLQEYFEYLLERNSTPSVILMGYFQFSNFYVFQNCINTIKDLGKFRIECHLPSEQMERLFFSCIDLWLSYFTLSCEQRFMWWLCFSFSLSMSQTSLFKKSFDSCKSQHSQDSRGQRILFCSYP